MLLLLVGMVEMVLLVGQERRGGGLRRVEEGQLHWQQRMGRQEGHRGDVRAQGHEGVGRGGGGCCLGGGVLRLGDGRDGGDVFLQVECAGS